MQRIQAMIMLGFGAVLGVGALLTWCSLAMQTGPFLTADDSPPIYESLEFAAADTSSASLTIKPDASAECSFYLILVREAVHCEQFNAGMQVATPRGRHGPMWLPKCGPNTTTSLVPKNLKLVAFLTIAGDDGQPVIGAYSLTSSSDSFWVLDICAVYEGVREGEHRSFAILTAVNSAFVFAFVLCCVACCCIEPDWPADDTGFAGAAVRVDGLPLGPRLHSQVPPERWCVTRQDLRDLRREVRKAVREGRVVPTELDPFDPNDKVVGPNFYTVVEQYIKDVTSVSKASWALQRHPDGLDCDIFVTHAWAEGVYELIDKVLASWPPRARNAWICTVAMPQHLDISQLIRTPQESPFAKALGNARQVLVIPNKRSSIYTRLWCVYEAFLAQQQAKIIRTAVRPHERAALRMLIPALLAVAVVMAASSVNFQRLAPAIMSDYTLLMATTILEVLTLTIAESLLCCVLNFMGTALSALWLLKMLQDNAFMPIALIQPFCGLAYFLHAELDRARLLAHEEEVANLKRGFAGSVLQASCTSHADELAIWEGIGADVERVDNTIGVLMKAKISTPLWTGLAEKGFDIQDAAFVEWAPAYGTLSFLSNLALFLYLVADSYPAVVAGVASVIITWLAVMLSLEVDRLAFSFRMLQKMLVLWLCAIVLMNAVDPSLIDYGNQRLHADTYVFVLSGIMLPMLALSVIPPLLLARVPCVGRFLVGFSLRRVRVRLLPLCVR